MNTCCNIEKRENPGLKLDPELKLELTRMSSECLFTHSLQPVQKGATIYCQINFLKSAHKDVLYYLGMNSEHSLRTHADI